jgi:foldase protein PrsA
LAKGKNSAVIIIVIAVILAAVVGIILYSAKSDSIKTRTMVQISKDGKVVAEISDAEYQYTLLNYMLQVQDNYSITDTDDIAAFWQTEYNGVTQLEQVKSYSLQTVEYGKIEYLEAIENGIKLTEDEENELQTSLNDLEQQFKDADLDLNDYLVSNYGISYKIYEQISEYNMIASKYSTEQIENVEVTDDEVLSYYNDNIDTYYTVTVRHILLLNTDSEGNALDDDALLEKLALANDLLERINNGEDMDALVTEYSEDSYASDNNGYYDVKADSGYVTEFQDWVMSSEAGDTAVIESDYGYHVIKTYSIAAFEDVKDTVTDDLKKSKYSEVLSAKMTDKYDVVVYDTIYDSVDPLS